MVGKAGLFTCLKISSKDLDFCTDSSSSGGRYRVCVVVSICLYFLLPLPFFLPLSFSSFIFYLLLSLFSF